MKTIPFFKSKLSSSSKNNPGSEPEVIEQGSLGKLQFKVYKRGTGDVLHIFNKEETLNFKKDCSLFEDEIKKLNLDEMLDGESLSIKASGDNDTLVFTCAEDDIEISLERPSYPMVEKLRGILRGKNKK
jgi:hypothetical protein